MSVSQLDADAIAETKGATQMTREDLTARYKEAIKAVPLDDDYRDNRARLAREYARDMESLSQSEVSDESWLVDERKGDGLLQHVGTGKPVEKIRGIRI